jgi:7,8-dihydro-6-hydroxymethylpterin-pyrophosphokinase
MALAFIGLGGNIGDTTQLIKDAIVCLAQHPELRVLTRSCMYKALLLVPKVLISSMRLFPLRLN